MERVLCSICDRHTHKLEICFIQGDDGELTKAIKYRCPICKNIMFKKKDGTFIGSKKTMKVEKIIEETPVARLVLVRKYINDVATEDVKTVWQPLNDCQNGGAN